MRLVSSFSQRPPPGYDHDLETAVQVIIDPVPGMVISQTKQSRGYNELLVWRRSTTELTSHFVHAAEAEEYHYASASQQNSSGIVNPGNIINHY